MASARRITVEFLGDAKSLEKSMAGAGDATGDLTKRLDKVSSVAAEAPKRLDRVAGSADDMAGKSERATGALGALSSGFELVGLEGYATGLQSAAMATDFFSGVGDSLSLVLETQALTTLKARLATVQKAMADVLAAGKSALLTKATKVQTVAMRALNVVMRANPIGLVVTALAALAAGTVYAYKKSETFRRIVDGAFEKVRAAAKKLLAGLRAVWGGIRALFSGDTDRIKQILARGWDAVRRVAVRAWDGISGMIRGRIGAIVDGVRAIPARIRALGGLFKSAGRAVIGQMVDGLRNAAGVISGIAANVWDAVRRLLNGAISRINSALEFTISLPGPDVHINPPNIPQLATGGIVKARPGGTLAVLGEGGHDEAVIPLSGPHAPRLARHTSETGTVINITVNGALDPNAVARQIETLLLRRKRVMGRSLAF